MGPGPSPLNAANAAYLEQLSDSELAPWLAEPASGAPALPGTTDAAQVAVLRLINAYRYLGVRRADLDPLKRFEIPDTPELDPAYYGLGEADQARVFDTGSDRKSVV